MANRSILIVEDEATLGRILYDSLSNAGYDVMLAVDGIAGLEAFKTQRPDVVIADIMMPNMDGMSMVEQIRKMDSSVEILFLSARSTAEDVVEGFRRGGNDYLRKPFALDELHARIAALLARHPIDGRRESCNLAIGRYHFDSQRWTLTINGTTRRLTARESAILAMLATSIGEIVDSAIILREIWGDDSYYNLRSLNVYISKLRNYLCSDSHIEIQSVRNSGYRLIVADDSAK